MKLKNEFEEILFDSESVFESESEILTYSPVIKSANSKELAMKDLEKTLLKSTRKELERFFYLSSIDPGSGKTGSIKDFLKRAKSMKSLAEHGLVLFVNTLDEIRSYQIDAELDYDDFAIWCSDEKLNALGLGASKRNFAKILITTQEKFRMHVRGSFESCEEFFYMDKPRASRIWDEGMLPATPKAVLVDEILKLFSLLRPSCKPFVETLEEACDRVSKAASDGVIEFPRFKGVPTPKELKGIRGLLKVQGELIKTLISFQWQKLDIRHENIHGKAVLGLSYRFPDDLAPVVILDGSGRLKATYRLWEKRKGNLKRLSSHAHDYANLKINLWNKSCGKTELMKEASRTTILEQVADVINRDREEWLIIFHKDDENGRGYSLETELRAMVKNPNRLHFRHWGLHKATNEFRHVKRVMVIGLWYYPESLYDAYYRAASGTEAGSPIDPNDIHDLKRSEHQDHLLQAICRTNVRNVDADGKCGEAEAYVIGSKHGVTKRMLEEAFPGSTVNMWEPVTKPLKGHAADLIEELRKQLSGGVTSIAKKEIREAIGVSKSHFSNLLSPDVRKRISDEGFDVEVKCFRRRLSIT